eukprot:GFUD01078304.1.p1 GENE.GFUD01078304.1~~GFUD01078304.1.p1  ORF type:complete len:194 (-),score=61.49 GFUD01078304.1:110-691(-)
MSSPSAPQISHHEESPPPPPYSEVVCPRVECDNNATQTNTADSNKATVTISVLAVALVIIMVMGCIMVEMMFRLNSLQVTVEEVNTREVEVVKLQLQSLVGEVENITSDNEVLRARIEQVSDQVDRLQLQKGEAQPYYLMVADVIHVYILLYELYRIGAEVLSFQGTTCHPGGTFLLLLLAVCRWLAGSGSLQ